MPLPFHVSCRQRSILLFELRDGRFQLLQQGPVAPFMPGFRYLLVEHPLASFLSALAIPGLSAVPATLFNRGTGEEYHTHSRLIVGQFFRAEKIQDTPRDGCRVFTMDDREYFVSPALKAVLECSEFSYLRFSEGLSEFAFGAKES